jgi:hypothetical protein
MMKATLKISALALCLGLSAPAFANDQNQANTANNNSSAGLSSTTVINDYVDEFWQDNGPDSYSETVSESYQANNNTKIYARQELSAVNTNHHLDEVVDLDGQDDTDTAVGYNSGSNSVNGNAFAAFAGIANQAWNTGINANTQAATNIAAQGTVNFGVNSGDGAAAGGGGGGGDD